MLKELFQALFLISFAVGAVLLMLLLKRRLFIVSNRICASFILVSLIPLWSGYFGYTENLNWLAPAYLELLYPWLYGPLIYLYCIALHSSARITLTRTCKHCCYPLLVLLIHQISTQFGDTQLAQLWQHLYLKLLYAQLFGYLLLSFRQIRIGQQLIESQFAGSQNLYWQWLMLLLNGFSLIFIADLVMLSLLLVGVMQQRWVMSLFTLSESIYVFVLAAFAMRHPQLIFDRFDVSQKHRYQNSGLNQVMAEALAKRLEDIVESKKLYLENELSLSALAHKLQVPEQHISQVLSEQLQQNFYEFINRKRIEHAKSLLSSNDPQYSNILAVAYGVGFNNKTSFNTAFKRFTQLTPSQFRQGNAPHKNKTY